MSITATDILKLFDDEDESLETVVNGDWEVEHKYEHRTDIVRHLPTGRYFAIDKSRSGSYWSDYHYDEPEAREVEPKQVTVTQWVTKA